MTHRNLASFWLSSFAVAVALLAYPASPARAQGLFGPPTLYPAAGGATFVTSVAVGDFNRDGSLDIALAGNDCLFNGGINVLLSNGDGTFQPAVSYPASDCPYALAVGDFNGDGNLDLAVANPPDSTVSVLLGNGDGTFGPATDFAAGIGPVSVVVGDFNGDGKLDLAVANGTQIEAAPVTGSLPSSPKPAVDLAAAQANTVSILLGNGDGTFQPPLASMAHSQPDSIAAGDFNGDGKLDLAVTNYLSNDVSILLGNGDGTFAAPLNIGVRPHPASVATGDFNGDGKLDLAVADGFNGGFNAVTTILLGNGDGTFSFAQAVTNGGDAVAVGDFNLDGSLDVAEPGAYVALGNGNGTFQTPFLYSVGSGEVTYSLAVGDLNGDGKPDIVAGVKGAVSVLLNTLGPVVSLSSSSLDFGQVTVGSTSATQRVTLTNTGTAALDVSSVTLTGTNPKDFVESNNCGASIAIGASCTVRLAFRPLARGTRTASATITDNAANSPQSISLSGTGEPK